MKIVIVLSFLLAVAPAFEMKPCEELKSEIAARLDARGVKSYQLEVIAAAEVKDQTVVGSCEGGTKKITYQKGGAVTEASAGKSGTAAKPSPVPAR